MDALTMFLPWFVEVILPKVVGYNEIFLQVHSSTPNDIKWQVEEVVTLEVAIQMAPENLIEGYGRQINCPTPTW